MVTSVQEWVEHVQWGGTVLRAPVSPCPVHQEPTLTGWWMHILHTRTFKQLSLLFFYVTVCVCVCTCLVAVFIWQTLLAVVHAQRVTFVALQVSLVHLDCVRQDSSVPGETQQPQVQRQNTHAKLISFVLMGWKKSKWFTPLLHLFCGINLVRPTSNINTMIYS